MVVKYWVGGEKCFVLVLVCRKMIIETEWYFHFFPSPDPFSCLSWKFNFHVLLPIVNFPNPKRYLEKKTACENHTKQNIASK